MVRLKDQLAEMIQQSPILKQEKPMDEDQALVEIDRSLDQVVESHIEQAVKKMLKGSS